MTQWPLQSQMKKFYGNPDVNADGVADRVWEDVNIVRFAPPYKMYLAWAPGTAVKKIAINKLCFDALEQALTKIKELYPTEGDRAYVGVDQYGGAYNFRTMRGSTNLSTHAFGAAIDLDPVRNPLGKVWRSSQAMMPKDVVRIFNDVGAVWGGSWSRPDAQHFQFARVG